MKKQLLLLVMMFLPMAASADLSGTCGDNVTWSYEETTQTLTISGSGNMMGYYGIYATPWYSFYQQIEKVIIEEGVTSIGSYAFQNCSGLASVTIGKNVTSIGEFAFWLCSGLTSVHISDLEAWCKISFGDGIANPLCLAHHLYLDGKEIKDLVIPNNITAIGSYAFNGCSGLTSVTIPSSVTNIGGAAFSECSGLTSVTIPRSVTTIGNSAFYGCSGLISVTIPRSVTTIGNSAFSECSSLTSVTIPSSMTAIRKNTFAGCSSLTSVTIPNSVTTIEKDAFGNCFGLTSVHISDLEAWCKISFGSSSANPLSLAHHLFLDDNEIKDLVIPNSVTAIGQLTFYGCTGLTSVTIPSSVTTIKNWAFEECTGLTSVTIAVGLTSIGAHAFYDCNSLTYVTIPNSVTNIGQQAFAGCNSLTSVTIPNNVESIEYGTFAGCYSIRNIYLPENLQVIKESAFSECVSLTSVTIPNSVKSIEYGTFEKCYNIRNIHLPDNLQVIKQSAFSDCGSLNTISIPSKVEFIYQDAFSGCNSLTEIKAFPSTPPFIYNNTFSNFNATLKVPDAAKDAYIADEVWGKFTTIQTLTGEDVNIKICATPTISYSNGKLLFSCETEDVEYYYEITDADIKNGTSAEILLTATYNISVYATKAGYNNSDVATATLCWVDSTPQTEGISNGITQVPAHAVMIQNNGGTLNIQGVEDGTSIRIYSVNGVQVGSAVSSNGQAMVNTPLQQGSVAIVKIGQKSIKVVVK